jgi:carbon monoxide dehydrogenase subunit G
MKLGSSFVVPAEPARVFAHFLDPDSMRASIPGCAELERVDGEHYRGRLVNEIAHVRFSAGFSAEITEVREPSEVRAVLKGEDRKLASSIKIDALLAVSPGGTDMTSSRVDYSMEVALWGKIGRMGESIVRRRSQEVERQFVAQFSAICAGGPPGPDNPALAAAAAAPPARSARAARKAAASSTGSATSAGTSTGTSTGSPAGNSAGTAAGSRVSWWRRLVQRLFGRRR